MRILVTGGAGYIGSHTAKALARSGLEVVVYDNLSSGHRDLVKWGEFVHGDIRDYKALAACIGQHRPDGVIHFAAKAYVGESVTDPGKYFSNNVCGTLALLEAMRDHGVANLVVSGTCAVYGQPETMPIGESEEPKPVNPYGASKLFMERMLADFRRAHGLNWTSLRYFNAAGCDVEGDTGERHDPETHIIPRTLMAAVGMVPELVIFGDKLNTPDGTCVRDYIHVTDLAEAHIKAMRRLLEGGESGFMNLGTGIGCSVREIVTAVERVTGRKVPNVLGAPRPGDPETLIADNSRAAVELGWTPKITDVDAIVASAWKWFAKDNRLP